MLVGVGSPEDTHLREWDGPDNSRHWVLGPTYFDHTFAQPLQPHGLTRSYPVYAFIGAYLGVVGVISLFFLIVGWKLFSKAGQPGWAVLILLQPVHLHPNRQASRMVDAPLLLKLDHGGRIARGAGDRHHGFLALGQSVWKSTGFGVGLILLSFIFLPILAFEAPTTTQNAWTTLAALHSSPDRIPAGFCHHGRPPRQRKRARWSALSLSRWPRLCSLAAHPKRRQEVERSADPIDPSLLASNMQGLTAAHS